MPAQIVLSHEQLATLAEQGFPCIVHEMPSCLGDNRPVEAWVIDHDSAHTTVHRTVVVDVDGEIISDLVEKD